MSPDSLNPLMIDVLWCGDPREKVTQTVTLSKLNDTMGLIMVWTVIPLDGCTYLYMFAIAHMTAAIHRNAIREPIVRQYEGAIVDAFMLMQYNARAHTVRVSVTFHDDEGTSVMNWPTSSADLNPIEHACGILSRRMRQRPPHPGNVDNLIDALVQELQAIPQKGIRSMPRRCQEFINDKGGHTSYW